MKYTGDDIYCDQIIPGKIDVKILGQNSRVIVLEHHKPLYPVHIVVVPKKHISSFSELPKFALTAQQLMLAVSKAAEQVKKEHGACRIITSLGDYQESKHLQFNIVFGKKYE